MVITGGSRGIGREIAVDFAKAGAQTVIVSSSDANLAAATKTIAAAGGPAPLAITADLRKLEGVPAGVRHGEGQVQPLRHPGELGGRDQGRQFRRSAGRGLDGRLCAEALRLRADVPAVLADAEGGAGPCRQHQRRRGALARRRLHHRRLRSTPRWAISPRRCRSSARRTASTSTSSIPARPRPSGFDRVARHALEGVRQVGRPVASRRPPSRTASAGSARPRTSPR